MRYLGNILFLLSIFTISLFGAVDASVDSKNVVLGDSVTLRLTISGENIQEPTVDSICGNDIVSTGTQTSITMVNGSYTKSYILSYRFVPQKDCTIEPITVKIDGKVEKSNPIKITVGKPTQTKDANFMLTLQSDKKEVFVGEPFEVKLVFKQRRDADAVDSKFVAPKLKGFWIKNQTQPTRSRDNTYITSVVTYTMAAQRTGELTISPAQMKIASRVNTRDFWGGFSPNVKWKTYFSNELRVKVDPLPGGVNLIGDFNLTASADKNEINPNEAVNIVVKVQGEGNLEDIKTFKPYIDGVNVFDEKIKIQGDVLTQKLAFISDSDFTIPPFTLRFYNPKTKQIQSVTTKEIPIHVKGGAKKQEKLEIKREEQQAPQETDIKVVNGFTLGGSSLLWMLAAFFIGAACGIVLMLLQPWQLFKHEKKVNIGDPKVILMKLLPYKFDKEVAKILDDLEKSIYSNEAVKVDKKALKTVIKRYKL